MINSDITSLPIDNPLCVAVDLDRANNLIAVRLKVRELDVVAIITKVSIDFNIVVNV